MTMTNLKHDDTEPVIKKMATTILPDMHRIAWRNKMVVIEFGHHVNDTAYEVTTSIALTEEMLEDLLKNLLNKMQGAASESECDDID
ncbi:Uncharacterised protein [Neisseria zoodegmatis]|uniref:Uncharacterized protein n=1 Tax=Neisseria zoodegmatis TaxID=326523 RepID=A0A378X5I7_9NEIS|nr:hypothetical protein [Neisseria zoodegmatis]SUA48880.1 Uncharacterised protein [Neisseria zoodegmatis]